MGWWRLSLYPDAAEAGGSFFSASSWFDGTPGRAVYPLDSRDAAARRARAHVRRYCAANRLNRLGTLTYAGQGCFEPEALRVDLAGFFRRLRTSVGESFSYLWAPEWHPKGHGLHAHFAVGRFIPVRAIRAAWGRGHVHIKLLGDLPVGSGTLGEARLAARYLSKYVSKDLGAGGQPPGLHRYEVAQGFQPKVVEIIGATDAEVLRLASVRMGGEPEHVGHSRDLAGWAGPPAVWASWA